MPAVDLPTLLVGGIALLALLLVAWQLLVSRRLSNQLAALRQQLAEFDQAQSLETPVNFSTRLDSAERQQSGFPAGLRNSPEKYRYVAALAEQGLDAQGISAALKLAPAEVEQLLQLARLKPQKPLS